MWAGSGAEIRSAPCFSSVDLRFSIAQRKISIFVAAGSRSHGLVDKRLGGEQIMRFPCRSIAAASGGQGNDTESARDATGRTAPRLRHSIAGGGLNPFGASRAGL